MTNPHIHRAHSLGCTLLLSSLMSMLAWPSSGDTAAAPDSEPEVVVVTGTRIEGSASSIPAHVTVIDREMLESARSRSVLDALQSVAGLNVTQYGGRGGVSSVYLRGAEPNFTAVFIDGARVNDPNNSRGGSFDFSTINLAEVERIEIARGTQSSIYGADALAGVINIVTRDASAATRVTVDGELGEDEFRRGSFHVATAIRPGTEVSLTAAADDDGDTIAGNEFSNKTLTGRIRNRSGDARLFELSGRYADSKSEAFPEDSGGPELAVLRAVDQRDQTQGSVSGRAKLRAAQGVEVTIEAGYLDHDEQYISPGIAPGVLAGVPAYTSDSVLDRANIGAYTTLEPRADLAIVFGVDYQDERGSQEGNVELFPGVVLPTDFDLDRDMVGLFTELRADVGHGVSASASIRHDDPSEAHAETTARIGAQYQIARTRVFGSYGEGYKLPSFFALGHALVGNPDLQPETSTSWEIGVSREALDGRFHGTLTGFVSEYQDLIDFDFDLFTNVNRSKVDIQGFELAADLRPLDTLTLSAHLTHLDIDVEDATTTLRQRPDWSGGMSARWDLGAGIALSADWESVGSVFDSSVPTGGLNLDGYSRLDVVASWDPLTKLSLWLAVDNVLDESYQEAIGFPALGIRGRVGFRYTFGAR